MVLTFFLFQSSFFYFPAPFPFTFWLILERKKKVKNCHDRLSARFKGRAGEVYTQGMHDTDSFLFYGDSRSNLATRLYFIFLSYHYLGQ